MQNSKYKKFMQQAISLAKKALANGHFPVGVVIEYQGKIIVSSHRQKTKENELDHAEILALRKLSKLKNIKKKNCTLYTTLEPCLMCFGAICINKIGRIIYAYEDIMGGGINCDLSKLKPLYKKTEIIHKFMRKESILLFQDFFLKNKEGYLSETLLSEYTLRPLNN